MRANTWFTLLVAVGLVAVMTPVIVLAAGGSGTGFDAVVHGIESRYHTHATKIPFMGLISGIAGISTHDGVRGIHVAEIENLSEPVDGAELNALVEQHVGNGWQRMVRETSRNGDQTLIYMKPDGSRMGLLVVDLVGHEMNVVQVSVDPDHLKDEMGQFGRHHHEEDDSGASDGNRQESAESE